MSQEQVSGREAGIPYTLRRGALISVALKLALICALAVLALGLFAQTVHNNSHNEQMYVTAGLLAARGEELYADFAFVQTPYTAQTFALVYRWLGAENALHKAKLVTYGFFALSALLLTWGAQRAGRDVRLTGLLLALYLSNYYTLRSVIEASNYTMPAAFALGSYLLLREPARNGGRWAAICFAAGLLAAGAIGSKLYYASLLAPLGLAAIFVRQGTWRERLLTGALPFAAGTLLGLLPLLLLLERGVDRFLFNNLGYHTLNALWREQNGFTETMTWASKLATARDLLANPNYLILAVWLGLAFALPRGCASGVWTTGTIPPLRGVSVGVLLAAGLAGVALVTAFTPRPLFNQYFAMPIPFTLALMAELYGQRREHQPALLRLTAVIALVSIVIIWPRHESALRRFVAADNVWAGNEWAGTVATAMGQGMRAEIERSGLLDADGNARVATLAPVYPLEGGLEIYRELATGSFVFRIGDLLSEEERARYVATSFSTLAARLDADPPAAIFIGDEGESEIPLLEYAESRGYRPAEAQFPQGQLFLR